MLRKLIMLLTAAVLFSAFILLPGDKTKNAGIEISSMDKTVNPKDDFYRYANGTWIKNNPVPAEEARWGSFDELKKQNDNKLKAIFENIAQESSAPTGSNHQKLRDFYLSAMDTITINKQGINPVKDELEMINAINSNDGLMNAVAELQRNGIGTMFSFYVTRDIKKSDQYISYIGQGGYHLPDKDYYLKDDDKSKKIREEYKKHIVKMFSLMKEQNTDAKADKVIAMETAFAKVCKSRVELRDQEKNYFKYSVADLQTMTPDMNWNLYFKKEGAASIENLVVRQPEFFKALNGFFNQYSFDDWKTYLTWHLINNTSNFLSSDFEKEDFYFNDGVLNGVSQMKPRWKDVLASADANIGEIVGEAYVEKYFSAESKQRVQQMVNYILQVYQIRIQNLDWMSAETKKKALEKLSKFNTKFGYTDKWKDYSKLEIKRDAYATNVMRCSRFLFDYNVSKLGKPVDKTEWQMLPHQINAYYEPTLNEIVFPAAIMQPPFFYADADDAVNYGAIGAVIGHEISHGFDDQGSKYDGNGNLNNWWTDEDRSRFNERTHKIIEQFNQYEALPGVNVNGQLTLGENIADLGGLNVSYQAYMLSLKGKPKETINGFTPEQRFFLAFAQVWKSNFKDEYLRKMVMTNPHAPGPFRAIAAPSNMPEFYQAFDVKVGDKMYRDENVRAKIW